MKKMRDNDIFIIVPTLFLSKELLLSFTPNESHNNKICHVEIVTRDARDLVGRTMLGLQTTPHLSPILVPKNTSKL